MRIAVTGSRGLVGSALIRALEERGDTVVRVVRSFTGVSARERVIVWHPEKGVIESGKLEGLDAVVHLAGESLAGVWTPGKKREIRRSRVEGTELLSRSLAAAREKPGALISASGVDYYGDRPGGEPVDEDSPPGTGFMSEVAVAWERAADPARAAGIRVVHTRFAVILSPEGGFLRTLLPLFRLGLGATLGRGTQLWPWVALDDVVNALLFVLDRSDIAGPVNVVAPEAVTHERLTEEIARAVGRPSFLRVPAFALRIAPGNMADQLLLGSKRVVPRRLQEAGFTFRWPELRPALEAMLRS